MARKVKEIHFTMPNKVGQLSRVTEALKKAKVNILHIAAWSEGKKAHFQIVTDKNAAAKKALKPIAAQPREVDVIAVNLTHRVGSLDRAAGKLAKAGVNIGCLMATTSGKKAAVIIRSNKNSKAAKVI